MAGMVGKLTGRGFPSQTAGLHAQCSTGLQPSCPKPLVGPISFGKMGRITKTCLLGFCNLHELICVTYGPCGLDYSYPHLMEKENKAKKVEKIVQGHSTFLGRLSKVVEDHRGVM